MTRAASWALASNPEESESYDCPDGEVWQSCGDSCTAEPTENAWWCETESATGCKVCGEDLEQTIEHANNIGSCLC